MNNKRLRLRIRSCRVRLRAARGRLINRRIFLLCGVAASSFMVSVATAFACGWFGGEEHSVRFRSHEEREFTRLPPLPLTDQRERDCENPLYSQEQCEFDYEAEERLEDEAKVLWDKAENAEESGDLALARQLLRDFSGKNIDCQECRNSAVDRLDAMAELDHGEKASAVHAYLKARYAYDLLISRKATRIWDEYKNPLPTQATGPSTDGVESTLNDVTRDSRLADNVAYLRAALLYRDGKMDEAASAFKALAAHYPQSEKREAALFMSGVALMRSSTNFQSEDETCSDCLGEAGRAAVVAFERVIREYPNGRYARDARGWLGYLALHGGDRAGALVQYYRLLADAANDSERRAALVSVRLTRAGASEAEMLAVEKRLAGDPAAAFVYAYHSIYNYAPHIASEAVSDYDREQSKYISKLRGMEWERAEKEEEKNGEVIARRTVQKELARVADFATTLMRRYPGTQTSANFALRVAEANFELDKNKEALEFARRALTSSASGAERAQALWVKGAAEQRLHDLSSARETLRVLVAENPRSPFTEGARRMLAMILEDKNDLEGALEQYVALDYREDFAYFVDVLMTPDQLAGFVAHHRTSAKIDELLYALGVRYLRAGRYREARETLKSIQTKGGNELEHYSFDDENAPYYAKDMQFADSYEEGVRPRWVMNDLQTADSLERLETEAGRAQGDEAKAEALYQLASYIYESPTVLFYNPAAWRGTRYENIAVLDMEGNYRRPGEAQTLWNYMQEHETIARALVIYLDIARRFPKTRAASDALYTAAVCHERLSGYSPYWRRIYSTNIHAGERMLTYEDVKAAYPDYRFPRATFGWEPSTRTVNGGPGRDLPPKPKLRLTGWERAKHVAEKLWEMFREKLWQPVWNYWDRNVRRYLTILLTLLNVLIIWRFAARARETLREQRALYGFSSFASQRENSGLSTLLSSGPRKYFELRDDWIGIKRDWLNEWRLLAQDVRTRPTLFINLITHSLLCVLLLKLAAAIFSG